MVSGRMVSYLDKWASLKDDYVSIVIKTIKAIFTRVRQEKKPVSAYRRLHSAYRPHEVTKLDRVDLVATNAN